MADIRRPPICKRISDLRKGLFARDKGPAREERRSNNFSQEAVARQIGVSLKAYRAYELNREPDYERRQAIAQALELPSDYFEGPFTQNQELASLREEVEEVRGMVAELLRRTA